MKQVIEYVDQAAHRAGLKKRVPVHVLIETHGALRDVFRIAELPHIEVLDFGLMDFVSGHHGAIPAAAMRSPGQFEHALLRRAKADVVAAALANGIVPSHNVCLNLKDAVVIGTDAARAHNEYGFLRMWNIYPAQILPIVEAMRLGRDPRKRTIAPTRPPLSPCLSILDTVTSCVVRAKPNRPPPQQQAHQHAMRNWRACSSRKSRAADAWWAACCPPSTNWPVCTA
ncbi:hypothetical protein LMG28688_04158 [Paraburkholderia caffeinitolerans]|uniref:Uncharacterized protein n=1 Tax=Paraburkholderia caffeinitolerans TaxID=1723730 RepID=A0A6J5GDV0_9BURK|nr:hypothetical protein LMG28688_04158 [Paraburkholderia caffeinitolerans]